MTRTGGACVATLAGLFLLAAPANARAELIFFSTGRVMSAKAHRVEGANIVLLPRGGGEITMSASVIARIEPDEVPYPEPEAEVENVAIAPAASPEPQVDRTTPTRYDPIIDRVSAEQGVDAKLVRAVIQVESGYQESARSPKGAMGLMQLMPETARHYAVANPYDPAANIEGGIKYLKSLLDRFPVNFALAAYNAGEAAVERFHGIPPYQETQAYVSRILQLVAR
jgi:soluble lytic murein transglycosylase-like protein